MKLLSSLKNIITEQTGKTIQLPKQTFPLGTYSIKRIDKNAIDDAIQQITDFANQHQSSRVLITIDAGESAVTNYDREKYPSGGGTPLPKGTLATLRANTIKTYLQNSPLKNIKNLTEPQITTNIDKQKHAYTKGKDNPNDPKYLEDQYVTITLQLITRDTQPLNPLPQRLISKCLVDLIFEFNYDAKPDKTFYCRGKHICDKADFDVYLGRTKIGNINFNNAECNTKNPNMQKLKEKNPEQYYKQCSRYAKIIVTPQMAAQIANDPVTRQNKYMTLRLHCNSPAPGCHTSAPEVTVTNSQGTTIFERSCILPPTQETRTTKEIRLLKMDLCARQIQKYYLPANEQPPFNPNSDS